MWQETNNKLYRAFEFKDFSSAFAFMTRVALLAEKTDHHPTWTNTYNKVEMWLSTHSAGDVVTEKDKKLAEGIDKLFV
jgi:4a-hydroxytetrahydrobiopterin dehydratase